MNVQTNAPTDSRASGQGKGLADLFEHAVRDMYYAEKKIYKSLPKMIKAAEDAALKEALTAHREETMGHVETLETIFDHLGKRPRAEKCDAIDGILDEATGLLEDFSGSSVSDAAIVFSCQAVEHYEITRYGSMRAFAEALGHSDAAELIDAVLAEEKAADEKLSSLSMGQMRAAA